MKKIPTLARGWKLIGAYRSMAKSKEMAEREVGHSVAFETMGAGHFRVTRGLADQTGYHLMRCGSKTLLFYEDRFGAPALPGRDGGVCVHGVVGGANTGHCAECIKELSDDWVDDRQAQGLEDDA